MDELFKLQRELDAKQTKEAALSLVPFYQAVQRWRQGERWKAAGFAAIDLVALFGPEILKVGSLAIDVGKSTAQSLVLRLAIESTQLDTAAALRAAAASTERAGVLVAGEKVAAQEAVNTARLVGATTNALSREEAFKLIDEFRRLAKGLEPLGGKIPARGDALGTVALTEGEGQRFFGVNSSLLSDSSKDLGREVFSMMWEQGLLKGATSYGQGAAQVLTHAEADSLMRMWKRLGTRMPAKVTVYVDRYTCSVCQRYLGEVANALGVKELTVITKSGETILIPIP